MEITAANYNDHISIASLHAENWRQTYRGILSDQYLDHEVDEDRLQTWKKRLANPSSNQYLTVAKSKDELIGFCCLFIDDDPVFGSLIDNLHVSSGQRKSGIGKLLVKDAVEKVLLKASVKKMYLWVYESNTNARKAYEKMGGKVFETIVKTNPDGSTASTCRIVWDNFADLLI